MSSSTPTSHASTKVESDTGSFLDDETGSRARPAHRTKHAAVARDVLLFLIAFRILNALAVNTFFQPDEYFQSLEPAWQMAFGEGSGAWITWEWKHHLRSTIHPYLFAAVYWMSARLSDLFALNPTYRAELLIAGPKLLQACIAAVGDYYTWRLGETVYGRDSTEAWMSLALTVCNPWHWFCSTRTLSNCLETTLTVAALNSWPWNMPTSPNGQLPASTPEFSRHVARLRVCLGLAAVACILRPTNVLIWACLVCLSSLGTTTRSLMEHRVFLREAVLCGSIALGASVALDRLFYRQWTFPPLRFLYFNIAQSLAIFYGRNDWHYYLSQGYPLLLTCFLPFAAIGIYAALKQERRDTSGAWAPTIVYRLAVVSMLVPFVLSFISHKEVRFIYPLLPILHVLASGPAARHFRPMLAAAPFTRSDKKIVAGYLTATTMLVANVLIAIFATQYHQRGPLAVMTYLRREHEKYYLTQPPTASHLSQADTTMTVGFLMPCHSTPWRSHLVHAGIKAWALGCEPPVHLGVSERETYLDEADRFYSDPGAFVRQNLGRPRRSRTTLGGKTPRQGLGLNGSDPLEGAWDGRQGTKMWPDYLVFFEQLEPTMHDIAAGSGYRQCWRGWNSWFHDDWRRRGDIIVLCQRGRRTSGGV